MSDRIIMDDRIVVSRPSRWGNPYKLGQKCQRCLQLHLAAGSTIPCFEAYARARLEVEPAWLKPLRAWQLHCTGCPPGSPTCHARVLERLR